MKRPAFQFYTGDWMSDLKLRRCSPAARGVWMDVLCALHDSDDAYGLLRWPLRDIANTIGASMSHLRELVDKGVLRGSDSEIADPLVYVPRSGRKDGTPVTLVAQQPGPLWYSKRLVTDEYVRTIRGEGTRFGDAGNDPPKARPKPAPMPPFGDGSSSSSSSSASLKEKEKGERVARGRAAASPRPPPEPMLEKPPDVSEQTWADWVALRKEKKAKVSVTALRGAEREAAKLGWTLEAFLAEWCVRGSQGLKAEWIAPQDRQRFGSSPASDRVGRQLRTAALMVNPPEAPGDRKPAQPVQEVIDVTTRRIA